MRNAAAYWLQRLCAKACWITVPERLPRTDCLIFWYKNVCEINAASPLGAYGGLLSCGAAGHYRRRMSQSALAREQRWWQAASCDERGLAHLKHWLNERNLEVCELACQLQLARERRVREGVVGELKQLALLQRGAAQQSVASASGRVDAQMRQMRGAWFRGAVSDTGRCVSSTAHTHGADGWVGGGVRLGAGPMGDSLARA